MSLITACAELVHSCCFSKKSELTAAQLAIFHDQIIQLQNLVQMKYTDFEEAIRCNRSIKICSDALRAVNSDFENLRNDFLRSFSKEEIEGPFNEALRILNQEQMLKMATAELQFKNASKLHDLGFPSQIAITHPQFTRSLLESALVFTIAGFRNSTAEGAEKHGIRFSPRGEPLLKFQNEWKLWSEIEAIITFNPAKNTFVSKNDINKGWNYISPDGFVQKEYMDFSEIYPIEQLSDSEYQRILQHAHSFYNAEVIDPVPNIEKKYVLQLVTTHNKDSWGMEFEETGLTKNLAKFSPMHAGFRLVTPEGKVYSFGYQTRPGELRYATGFKKLTTIQGTCAVPDYQEFQPFTKRIVTSIPIAGRTAENIVQHVNASNVQGFCFNWAHQNCSKMGADVMKQAGISITTQMNIASFFLMLAPDVADLPLIGKPLDITIRATSYVASSLFRFFNAIIPTQIVPIIKYSYLGILHGYNFMTTIIANLFVWSIGGANTHLSLLEGVEDTLNNQEGHTVFSRLIHSWKDFFNKDSCTFHYCRGIMDWQNKQTSTQVFDYSGKPGLYLVAQIGIVN